MKQNGWQQRRKWSNGHALRCWVLTKNSQELSNLSGSSGSSGSTHIQQGFEHDPDVSPHLDHLDQYEAVQPENAIQLTISDPDDPDTQKHLDHPEPLHSNVDPDDPDDPDKFQTFFENNSSQVNLAEPRNPDPNNFPAEACPVTRQFMPAGFERTVKGEQVVFAPVNFKRGKKSLRLHIYIRGMRFEISIDWPQPSKDAMIAELEELAVYRINRYFVR
jgi:hypothetical protein